MRFTVGREYWEGAVFKVRITNVLLFPVATYLRYCIVYFDKRRNWGAPSVGLKLTYLPQAE